MSILEFFGWGKSSPEQEQEPSATPDTVRQIVDKLDHLPEDQARYLAAFAFMLSRVAHADLEISDEETRAMEQIVVDAGLPEDQAIIVVLMAKTQSRLFGGTENYLVAKEFNRLAARDQKLALLHCLFAVGAADDTISGAEDSVVRQIADELRVDRTDFIAVRSHFRDQLGVFQDPAKD